MVMTWLKKLAGSNPRTGMLENRPAPSLPTGLIPEDQIALRAYEKWLANGRPAGTSTRDWLEAEAELRAERRTKSPS